MEKNKAFDTMEHFCCRDLDTGVVGLHQPCRNGSLHTHCCGCCYWCCCCGCRCCGCIARQVQYYVQRALVPLSGPTLSLSPFLLPQPQRLLWWLHATFSVGLYRSRCRSVVDSDPPCAHAGTSLSSHIRFLVSSSLRSLQRASPVSFLMFSLTSCFSLLSFSCLLRLLFFLLSLHLSFRLSRAPPATSLRSRGSPGPQLFFFFGDDSASEVQHTM